MSYPGDIPIKSLGSQVWRSEKDLGSVPDGKSLTQGDLSSVRLEYAMLNIWLNKCFAMQNH